MAELVGYLGALLMGLSLGMVGGGGSIIALPILLYLFHIHPELAIVYSLFIVGSTSVFASANHIKQKNFDVKVAIKFGLASVIAVAFMRFLVMPNIPATIITIGNIVIKKSIVLLMIFSVLMLIVSIKMITGHQSNIVQNSHSSNLVFNGISVGILTGLIGAGGGFLIVPSLVNKAGLTMKKAIGTSLIIIGINSLIGFVISLIHHPKIDWFLLITFLAVSFAGTVIGTQLSKKIPGEKLKPIFGWFVLLTGIYIIIKELFFHVV